MDFLLENMGIFGTFLCLWKCKGKGDLKNTLKALRYRHFPKRKSFLNSVKRADFFMLIIT